MKEGLEEDLDRLKSRKDDMLTLAEIGVDQLIVDEMQEFRPGPDFSSRRYKRVLT
jgi:N12 class adenine-specific DNA methylase